MLNLALTFFLAFMQTALYWLYKYLPLLFIHMPIIDVFTLIIWVIQFFVVWTFIRKIHLPIALGFAKPSQLNTLVKFAIFSVMIVMLPDLARLSVSTPTSVWGFLFLVLSITIQLALQYITLYALKKFVKPAANPPLAESRDTSGAKFKPFLRGLYFFIFTALTAAVLIMPQIVILPAFVFPPLYLILAFLPSVYIYYLVFAASRFLFYRLKNIRVVLALVVTVAFSFCVPHFYNQKVNEYIKELTADDVNLSSPLSIDTISLIASNNYNAFFEKQGCNPLCQRLLYNEVAQRVIVRRQWQGSKDELFYIEKRDYCPAASDTLKPVSLRIASGECLINDQAPPDDPGLKYLHERAGPYKIINHPLSWVLKPYRIPAQIEKITVSKNESGQEKVLFRRTQVEIDFMRSPLIIGAIGGYGFDIKNTFMARSRVINDMDDRNDNKALVQELFGAKAVAEPVLAGAPANSEQEVQNKKQLMRKAFESADPQKQAGHVLFEEFLREWFISREVPGEDDIDIVVQGIKDLRVTDLSLLGNFVHRLKRKASVPDKLVQALGFRLVRDKTATVQYVSGAIYALPEGAAAQIFSQINQVTEETERPSLVWRAITRLGDAGKAALPVYSKILGESQEILTSPQYNQHSIERKPILGVLIGLCRMGAEALPEKEMIFSIAVSGSRLNSEAIQTLVQLGLTEELKQRYGSNQEQWSQIQSIIDKKLRDMNRKERKGSIINSCGYDQV